jgi:hypothetical protein
LNDYKKLYNITLFLSLIILCISCIGDDFIDDFVAPVVRITNAIDTIGISTTYQMEAAYFNNVGQRSSDPISWSSNAPEIININDQGLAEGLQLGSAKITASVGSEVSTRIDLIVVGETTEIVAGTKRSGIITTTSSYALEGNFELEETGGAIVLKVFEDDKATSALSGLVAYLSNNPNSISDAYEIRDVKIFEGAHSYTLSSSVGLKD